MKENLQDSGIGKDKLTETPSQWIQYNWRLWARQYLKSLTAENNQKKNNQESN